VRELFDKIDEYSREELQMSRAGRCVALEAVLLFFANKKNVFITLNFLSPTIDGNSVAILVSACFYYAVWQLDSSLSLYLF
jgi:hypothetical protein